MLLEHTHCSFHPLDILCHPKSWLCSSLWFGAIFLNFEHHRGRTQLLLSHTFSPRLCLPWRLHEGCKGGMPAPRHVTQTHTPAQYTLQTASPGNGSIPDQISLLGKVRCIPALRPQWRLALAPWPHSLSSSPPPQRRASVEACLHYSLTQ